MPLLWKHRVDIMFVVTLVQVSHSRSSTPRFPSALHQKYHQGQCGCVPSWLFLVEIMAATPSSAKP